MFWFLLFIISVGLGGFFALLVALARTPKISDYIPPELFYHWLIGHVDLALIIGLLSFLVFLWHRFLNIEEKLYEWMPAYIGSFLIFISALTGLGTGIHNNYIPTINHPVFFTGLSVFMLSFFSVSLRTFIKNLKELFSEDVLRVCLTLSAFLSTLYPLTLFISFIRTERTEEVYLYFERLYWLAGHTHQFINATLLISSWIILSRLSGRELPSFKYLLYTLIPFPLTYLFAQVFVEDSLKLKFLTTLGYAVGIGVPTIVYAIASVINAFNRNFFSLSLGLSAFIYLVGASMGYLIAGSDLRIPAHYHGVIASILLSIMALTYNFLKEFGRIKELPKIVKIQPFLYGFGMLLFVISLFWAGVYGAPRKTFGTDYIESFKVYLFMSLMGLGSVLSVLGGVIFVLYTLYAVFKRKD